MSKSQSSRLHLIHVFAFTVATLMGCSSRSDQSVVRIQKLKSLPSAAAMLPRYDAGDRYYYSSGLPETVLEISGNRIRWGRSQKNQFWGRRNFLLPRIEWQSREKKYSENIQVRDDFLWPLKLGADDDYRARRTSVVKKTGAKSSYDRYWDCEVEDLARVTVIAGQFDTYVIECRRTTDLNDYRQKQIWYYAPVLEHYVLRVNKRPGKKTRTVQLVAIEPGYSGRIGQYADEIGEHFQQAMETGAAGLKKIWKTNEYQVTVVPIVTRRLPSGRYCRNYQLEKNLDGNQKRYAGLVCRGTGGIWRIPGRRD